MIVKSAELECRGPRPHSGTCQPAIRAFMDDLTKSRCQDAGGSSKGLNPIRRARMGFKPTKSRSLVVKKGKVTDRFRFNIEGSMIPSVNLPGTGQLAEISG